MVLKSKLNKLLKQHDFTIAQLSRATSVPRQTLDNWLAGQEPRSLKQVKKVATHFGISIEQLCFGEEMTKPSIEDFGEEINAGVFEVVLRRVKK